MSKIIANPYAPEGNYSRFLENEFNKSLQFQKKHEKEINHLIAYQEIMKQEKVKNENKLYRLFSKQKHLDMEQKMKGDRLKELKVNKDQVLLYKRKEKDYIDQLDSSWCFYQEQMPGRDPKPYLVNHERQKVLNILEKQLKEDILPVEKAEIKQKIAKLKDSESSSKKLKSIENKIKHAHQYRSESLDRSIDKIKLHDIHIQDVLEKSMLIDEDKFKYFKDKIELIQHKIKVIEELQRNNQMKVKDHEHQKEPYRKIVKTNSQQLMLQKKIIQEHHLEQKNSKIESLESQRISLMAKRQNLIDQMEFQRKQVKNIIDHDKYPILNSINFKALNF